MMSPSRLTAWLKQVPRNVTEYHVIMLPQDEDPTKEKRISSYPAYSSTELSHTEFATMVLGEISNHCDNVATVTRYEIRALADKEVLSSRIVRAVPSPVDALPDPLEIAQNPIAANTSTQQLVRTIEALLRCNVQSFGMIQNSWREILNIQKEQIDKLLEREAQLADSVLVEVAKQADIEESEVRKTQAINKITDLVEKYAPTILANYVGEGVEPDN